MPWKISGNCVIRKDTGETIKCHANHEEAVAHLRALYANVKKSAIDKTVMVAKGAPLGNRNAAKDYIQQQDVHDYEMRRYVASAKHYREQGEKLFSELQTGWKDSMTAAVANDYSALADAQSIVEHRFKSLKDLLGTSRKEVSKLLDPDVDVPPVVMESVNRDHNQLYGVFESAAELRKLTNIMMRSLKAKLKAKKSVV